MDGNRRNGWFIASAIVIATTLAAVVAYNVGVSQTLAEIGRNSGDPADWPHWHRFGFGFPILFLVFGWMFLMRVVFWRPWRSWGYGGYGGPAGYYGPPPHVRDRFDEWHRQAHERMSGTDSSKPPNL